MNEIVGKRQEAVKKCFKDFAYQNRLLLYFLFVLVISWAIWIPMALNQLNIIVFEIPLLLGSTIGAFGPLLCLIILEKLTKNHISADKILKTIRIRGENRRWLIIAAAMFPLLTIGGIILNFIAGNEGTLQIFAPGLLNDLGWWLIAVIPLVLFAMLLSSPLLEEPGWRGFALGELQTKFGRQLGSLILGSFWWIWHIPIHIATGVEISLYFYLLMVSYSFVIDSIFNLSNRNLLSAMLAHSSVFIIYTFFDLGTNNWFIIVAFVCAIILLRVYEWKRERSDLPFCI